MEADTNRIRERALLIGQRIGNEDGIKAAMKLIERHTSEFKTNVDSVFYKTSLKAAYILRFECLATH